MNIINAIDKNSINQFSTEEIRFNFLIRDLFQFDKIKLNYTYYDRLIVGGVCPINELVLDIDEKIIGAPFLLDRREMGIINIGGKGVVIVDGKNYELDSKDCLYIGMGAKDISFASIDKNDPAKFYLNCAPAHKAYANTKLSINEAQSVKLGSIEKSNTRTIYKYIHPEGIQSCQLVMGLTILEPNNMWNTMPTHLHPRRIEVYLYFEIPEDNVLFHFMGEPSQTKHIVVRNQQAVLSPSWSIHSGVGTNNYSFIWGMAGENQTFDDMDAVAMSELK